MRRVIFAWFILSLLNLLGYACNGLDEPNTTSPGKENWTQRIYAIYEDDQSQSGYLYGVECLEQNCKLSFDTVPFTAGKNGFARPGEKREGDGKTPSGQFSLERAFGYEDELDCELNFIKLSDQHYWISESDSDLYNKLVDFKPEVYAEKMKRKDHLYKYGIVIEYNTKEIVKGKGSAIFIHIERHSGVPTAGCLAVSEEYIKALISWLRPDRRPHILMGIREEVMTSFQ